MLGLLKANQAKLWMTLDVNFLPIKRKTLGSLLMGENHIYLSRLLIAKVCVTPTSPACLVSQCPLYDIEGIKVKIQKILFDKILEPALNYVELQVLLARAGSIVND